MIYYLYTYFALFTELRHPRFFHLARVIINDSKINLEIVREFELLLAKSTAACMRQRLRESKPGASQSVFLTDYHEYTDIEDYPTKSPSHSHHHHHHHHRHHHHHQQHHRRHHQELHKQPSLRSQKVAAANAAIAASNPSSTLTTSSIAKLTIPKFVVPKSIVNALKNSKPIEARAHQAIMAKKIASDAARSAAKSITRFTAPIPEPPLIIRPPQPKLSELSVVATVLKPPDTTISDMNPSIKTVSSLISSSKITSLVKPNIKPISTIKSSSKSSLRKSISVHVSKSYTASSPCIKESTSYTSTSQNLILDTSEITTALTPSISSVEEPKVMIADETSQPVRKLRKRKLDAIIEDRPLYLGSRRQQQQLLQLQLQEKREAEAKEAKTHLPAVGATKSGQIYQNQTNQLRRTQRHLRGYELGRRGRCAVSYSDITTVEDEEDNRAVMDEDVHKFDIVTEKSSKSTKKHDIEIAETENKTTPLEPVEVKRGTVGRPRGKGKRRRNKSIVIVDSLLLPRASTPTITMIPPVSENNPQLSSLDELSTAPLQSSQHKIDDLTILSSHIESTIKLPKSVSDSETIIPKDNTPIALQQFHHTNSDDVHDFTKDLLVIATDKQTDDNDDDDVDFTSFKFDKVDYDSIHPVDLGYY